MGLFSKLFGQKKEADSEKNIKSEKEVVGNFVVETKVERIDPDVPPLQGDYAKTIFLWAHAKANPIKKASDYQHYFLYECGIQNCNAYHKELLKEGYFEEAPVEEMLKSFKVPELKEILTSIGQSVTGKKDVLIKRIVDNADLDTVKKVCPETLYVLSEKGKVFLEEYNDYVLLHKHGNWGVDWKEYDARRKNGYRFYDIMWGIFNERIVKDKEHFGRNEYLYMYQLLTEEGKREQALEMLLRVLYLDLSGIEMLPSIKLHKEGFYSQKDLIEHVGATIMLAPGIVYPIAGFIDIYNDAYIDKVYEQKLPIRICDKKLFASIVHSILDDTYKEEEVESKLKSEYEKFIRNL